MLMAAPIGAIQAESQRAAAAAQPLCSWRLLWSGADFDITDPKHRKLFCATTVWTQSSLSNPFAPLPEQKLSGARVETHNASAQARKTHLGSRRRLGARSAAVGVVARPLAPPRGRRHRSVLQSRSRRICFSDFTLPHSAFFP